MNLYVFLVSSLSYIITNKITFVWQTVKVHYSKPPFAIVFIQQQKYFFPLEACKGFFEGVLRDFYLLELSLGQNYNAMFL